MQSRKAWIKKIGAKPVILTLGLLGLVLLLAGSFGDGCTKRSEGEAPAEEYRQVLAREAEALCRQVKGAGEVHIMLTLESGEANTYSGSHVTSTTPPRVLGVAVVADGASSDTVRAELTSLLCALFRVGANRVHISPSS